MRAEISKLHKKLQATFMYVTHDQIEAMTMASRIAVINLGVLQQIGTPQNLYDTPDNLFVAGFIGSPSMNFFPAKLRKEGQKVHVDSDGFSIQIPGARSSAYESHDGKNIIFGVRPENIHNPDFVPPNTNTELIPAKVDVTELMGKERFLHLLNGKVPFVARVDPRSNFDIGDDVKVAIDMDNFHILDTEIEEVIR